MSTYIKTSLLVWNYYPTFYSLNSEYIRHLANVDLVVFKCEKFPNVFISLSLRVKNKDLQQIILYYLHL